ncbi:precorrin-4 C(11)-methyltransferase [Synechococcus sp. MIT S1220]|uniref:precorrin-4 C(11)-methyltransferase n=1 Tax=Synechococcus sp. MIT S1220 TaxID=3082549 RepID=UPI0039B02DC5
MSFPISFVGAGPGAPDLLTLRAAERLKQADLLVWTDSLVCPGILDLAPENCERVRTSTLTLEKVVPHLINGHQQGKRVVRLHDGDTALYSAINEQICALNDADLPVEVIPGISAYQAAAATLNRELTIPGLVQTIVLSRAGGRTGIPETEELDRLASLRSSLCLYLSARHVQDVQQTLLNSYPPDTPVAIAHRVSWPDEWISIVPLHAMAQTSLERNLIRTTLYIVSPALVQGEQRSKLYSPEHDHLFRPKS